MADKPEANVIARIIDPRPFERSGPKALYGDDGRRLQAMRKAGQILAHMSATKASQLGTSAEAETLAAKTPKDEGDE